MHLGDLSRGIIAPISMLGAMIPVMTGAALAAKMQGRKIVALTYLGDGGASTGDFHEGLNFAAIQKVPLVVVIENNGWAYSDADQPADCESGIRHAGSSLWNRWVPGRRQ